MITENYSRSQSNMPSQAMGIASNAVVFDLLVNRLYSNKPLAIIREYICNAYDAHVDAKTQHKPIRLHLPTRLEPFFSIRDFGTGMSEDTVTNVFSTLGESTKRESNEVTGMLGIGSKSALTANDSFMVTSFYEGTKSIYSIFLDNGMPNISSFGSSITEEQNGLEISVPIPSSWINDMQREAEKFLKYFSGEIEVNTEINLELGDVLFSGPNWKIYNNCNSPVVLMGNIPYPIDNEILRNLSSIRNTYGLVINAPIGSIQFAASRESISYTDSTIATLKSINGDIERDLLVMADGVFKKYEKNLLKLSEAMSALLYSVRNIITSKNPNSYFNSSFSINGGNDFTFKTPNYRGTSLQSNYSFSKIPTDHKLILVDNDRKAREVAFHYRDLRTKAILVYCVGYADKEVKATKLKEFCDIIGAPYTIASKEHEDIFGVTSRAKGTRGAVSSNLMYRAQGFTTTGRINDNSIMVNAANKYKTIGIPIYNGSIMDADYKNIANSSMYYDILALSKYTKIEDLVFVHIPKTHKMHLANTTDVFTWLASLKPVTIDSCSPDLKYRYTRDMMSKSTIKDITTSKNLIKYCEEVDAIYHTRNCSNDISAIGRLGVPVKVNEFKVSDWLKNVHPHYDVLKIFSYNIRGDVEHMARFNKTVELIEKEIDVQG